jgi:hypothetical protein
MGGKSMDKYTAVPEIDGLFWYFEQGAPGPRPVMIDLARWGKCMKSFNGGQQSWLRDGEYLLGPQSAPAPQ